MRRVIEGISEIYLLLDKLPPVSLACIEDLALTYYIVRKLFIWAQGRGVLSGGLGQQ